MQFSQKTILGLFDSSQKSIHIPVYQRAFSWDKSEWKAFLDDIREQINGNNPYFYGNLLLETIKKDILYEVIDGQQRLTTLTIFMRAIIDVLQKRKDNGETVGIDLNDKAKLYLKNGGLIKIRPVEYDQACYDTLIIDGKTSFETSTPSQKRILEAKLYFTKEIERETTANILCILNKVETTELTSIEFEGKKDSALMFELQNNRGKELTNMERLKSYLMYQVYVHSSREETETNIEYISNIFKLIYQIINDIHNLPEDSVLLYHCNAYVNGYNYRTLDDIKDVFKRAPDKIDWIKQFVSDLHTTFVNMKKLEICKDPYFQDLKSLRIPAFVYPFLIKGYKYISNEDNQLSKLFHIMEIVVFRYSLINSRADIISRLNGVLQNFNGDTDILKKNLMNKFNEERFWGDTRIKDNLDGEMYDSNVINYLLWKYEDSIQESGYSIGCCKIEDEQIEHIAPQTPTDGSKVATGYEIQENGDYDDEFKEYYLNCVGNLMLISLQLATNLSQTN
jgi:uncharacterized protein with ParB-like and HNH nuclease domain